MYSLQCYNTKEYKHLKLPGTTPFVAMALIEIAVNIVF